jgi:hypothetical protein
MAAILNQFRDIDFRFEAGAVHTTVDTATMRNILTSTCLGLNFLITMIGAVFLKRRIQRILLRSQDNGKPSNVPIHYLTTWLSLGSVISYVFKVRKLPGGIFGILMLWTGIFSLAHQYFINTFVALEPQIRYCLFEYGIVTTHQTDLFLTPSSTWPPALIVFDAHLALLSNGGRNAIYKKINWYTPTFRPGDADILGYWNCTEQQPNNNETSITPADWSDDDSLDIYLQQQNFLYLNESWDRAGAVRTNGSWEGFAAWSANKANDVREQWDVRATIANPLKGTEPIATSNFQCSISTVENWTAPVMPSQSSLSEWVELLYGFIRDVDTDSYASQLESLLNGMTMIVGSGNSAKEKLPADADAHYGCLVNGTSIGIGVFVLLAALLVIILLLLTADLYSFVIYRRHHLHDRVQEVPTDNTSWQVAAVGFGTGNAKLTTKTLKNYEYGWSDETKRMEFKNVISEVCYLKIWNCKLNLNINIGHGTSAVTNK